MTKASKISICVVLALAAVVLSAQAAQRSADAAKARQPAFKISGGIRAPISPGVTLPMDVKVRNPHRVPISISRLRARVVVDPAHRAAGCSPQRDFLVTQLTARAYPLKLGPRRTKPLGALGRRERPRLTMRNLVDVDQGACKGAKLTLRFTGRARPQKVVTSAQRRAAERRR